MVNNDDLDLIKAWLSHSRITLWGRSFNVVDDAAQAAQWFHDQLDDYYKFVYQQEEL
jgi:hypothetical protein